MGSENDLHAGRSGPKRNIRDAFDVIVCNTAATRNFNGLLNARFFPVVGDCENALRPSLSYSEDKS